MALVALRQLLDRAAASQADFRPRISVSGAA
jgi:hypothetical protein